VARSFEEVPNQIGDVLAVFDDEHPRHDRILAGRPGRVGPCVDELTPV
jgi:hypothetical protein